ncbi:AAA family ATPase [Candidatus Protofrankia californiensis]|uniref:nucleotide-binding protein n=1 Tax=Candidatus Protofrankia californiensis TaxID=1839754 RepID=UPI0019D2F510|nr:AAA family ATPase [Candidatus Protofrankia californiensis]
MSPSSSRSYLPPDPVESNNETSYALRLQQEPVRRVNGPADPQSVDVLTPPRTGVNGGPLGGPAGPPSVPPPQVASPPVSPHGGGRGFDPLTSSWPQTAYDPSPSSGRSPGTPAPDDVAVGFAVVDRYTEADNITTNNIAANNVVPRDSGHDTAGSWARPSFNPLTGPWAPDVGGNPQPSPSPSSPSLSSSSPSDTPGTSVSRLAQDAGTGGSGSGNAPTPNAPTPNAPGMNAQGANGRPWTESSTYDPLFDREIFPGGFTSAPPPPADRRTPTVPFRHEERPGDARRPLEPPDAGQNHASQNRAGQNRAGQGHREQNHREQGRHEQAHLPHTPVSTQHPAPASPLPSPAEQPADPSTAPFTMVPGEDPPFRSDEGYRNEQQLGMPFAGIAGTAFPYPDSPYPSTEYPAPPPSLRPESTGQRLRDNDFRTAGGTSEQNNQRLRDNDPRARGPEADPAGPGEPQEPDTEIPISGMSGRLMTSALLPTRPDVASRGWRRILFKVSGGTIKLGPSADEARHRRLIERINTPLNDCHRIAVMSLKGGVGKTTTAVGLGSTLASLRGDRIVAIDANPDRGTLGAKVPRTSENTVRDLLDNADSLRRYVDVRRYLSQAGSRLEVLASANAPEISRAFADTDYVTVDDILQRYYSILLTDCGTGMLHSAMPAILELADTLVIVSSSSADGGSSASATLDWLEAHGYATQVRNAVTVISTFPANRESVDLDTLEQHFVARTRRVVRVPYDPHLAVGGHIALEEMRKPTRQAFLEIAGAIAEQFGLADRRARDNNLFVRSEAETFGASEGRRAHDDDFSVHSEAPGNPAGRGRHDHAPGTPGALSG